MVSILVEECVLDGAFIGMEGAGAGPHKHRQGWMWVESLHLVRYW